MTSQFHIQSSDPALLQRAVAIAGSFAEQYRTSQVVGIVILGAVARGYFDALADVDVAVVKKRGSEVPFEGQYQHMAGIEIHLHLADYEDEVGAEWNMAKRWTYSQAQIVHDPEGKIARLLGDKVPLRSDERRWLLMSGLCLSEWYINRLSHLWVERGHLTSAHQMFAGGLEHFMDMLFAWNGELVPDAKWKYYCVEKLHLLPAEFRERMQATMLLKDFSPGELERRRAAFMGMWQMMLPVIEAELGMTYAQIMEIV